MKLLSPILAISALAWSLTGCVVNPVTGKSQVSLMSPEQEVAAGAQNYVPAQQSRADNMWSTPA